MIIKSNFLCNLFGVFFKINGITIFPFIIVRKDIAEKWINHEMIHYEQQKELLVIGFYIIYLYDFIRLLFKEPSIREAYEQIRFEREAYSNQKLFLYPTHRKKYSWRKYVV